MENINYVFFDEYKRLDRLCADMFGSSPGVTSYIESMKATPLRDCRMIGGWDSDLQRLIYLRGIRNRLAHEGSFQEELCTPDDIDWLKDFYDIILRQEDPLAQARKQREEDRIQRHTIPSRSTPVSQREILSPQTDWMNEEGKEISGWFVAAVIAVVFFLLLVVTK